MRRFPHHRPRILLVDDEPSSGIDSALDIQSLGYEVLGPCRTLSEARIAAAAHHPDAAIVDGRLGQAPGAAAFVSAMRDSDIAVILGPPPGAAVSGPRAADGPALRRPIPIAELSDHLHRLVGG